MSWETLGKPKIFNLVELVFVKNLNDIIQLPDFKKADIIGINEGQFFEDLVTAVKILIGKNKKVYVSGLDGDFQQQKFGHILDLIPICDKVTKLRAICHYCKDYGIFTKRLSNETAQKVIGVDNYVSVCRQCLKCKPILVE